MKKVFCSLLVAALLVTLAVPAHSPFSTTAYAAQGTTVSSVVYDSAAVARINSYYDGSIVNWFTNGFTKTYFWQANNQAMKAMLMGEVSYAQLCSYATQYENYFLNKIASSVGKLNVEVVFDPDFNCYRLYDSSENIYLVYGTGAFPYAKATTDSSGETIIETGSDHWVLKKNVDLSKSHVMAWDSLLLLCVQIRGSKYVAPVLLSDPFYGACWYNDSTSTGGEYFWCDKDNHPYIAAPPDRDDEFALNIPQDYYTEPDVEDGDEYNIGDTVSEQLVNIISGTLNDISTGSTYYIDDITYDMSSKTYNIDAHKEYNFDIENNTYIYYTYNYEYNYYINYTNVTYIGQTAEDKSYKYYYELPDGRSSADLTAEELEQLNTQIDVLPYIRSADDVSIRSLYHFDGDTHDSSYWNYCTSLDWSDGASITYLDAGAFGGCLYLDEKAHDFTFTLPSSLGTSDFTIEFRYYQSSTATPVKDSFFLIGGEAILGFTGDAFSFDNVLYPTSVGQWVSLCVQRSGNALSFYVNGVLKGSKTTTSFYGDNIRFSFGSQQQTFKYLDELRVTSKALYGSSYTPSAVPFDTNLALVLPDSKLPIADGYWNISCKNNLLTPYGLDNWVNFNASSNPHLVNLRSPDSSHLYKYGDSTYTLDLSQVPSVGYNPADIAHYSFTSEGVSFSRDGSYGDVSISHTTRVSVSPGYSCGMNFVNSGLVIPLGVSMAYYNGSSGSTTAYNYILYPAGQYVFTVVLSDGTIVNFPVSVSAPGVQYTTTYNDIAGLNSGNLRIVSRIAYSSGSYYKNKYAVAINAISLYPNNGAATPPIVYMALEPGTTSTVTAEYIEDVVVMDKSDLNTPSLAVKTDVDITGWQIGGVRPSLPQKGLVWALVEDGYITSLQIYTGYAWQAVDGRIWTGARWIPYSSYNVVTLQDMFDIVDANSDKTYIYTESGFWRWLQTAWTGMTGQLNSILLAIQGLGGGSGSGSGRGAINLDPEAPDFPDSENSSGEKWTVIELLGGVVNGVWVITTGVVNVTVDGVSGLVDTVGTAGDFFKAYNSNDPDSSLFGVFTYGGTDIWD